MNDIMMYQMMMGQPIGLSSLLPQRPGARNAAMREIAALSRLGLIEGMDGADGRGPGRGRGRGAGPAGGAEEAAPAAAGGGGGGAGGGAGGGGAGGGGAGGGQQGRRRRPRA